MLTFVFPNQFSIMLEQVPAGHYRFWIIHTDGFCLHTVSRQLCYMLISGMPDKSVIAVYRQNFDKSLTRYFIDHSRRIPAIVLTADGLTPSKVKWVTMYRSYDEYLKLARI